MWLLYTLFTTFLIITTSLAYPGQLWVYILFSLAFNILLIIGFLKNRFFFDTFLGVLFWLGFWLKLSVRLSFLGGQFGESTGGFDGSGTSYDLALLACTFGAFGFLLARLARKGISFLSHTIKANNKVPKGLSFYLKNRKLLLSLFFIVIVTVAVSNAYFGIYQRGSVPLIYFPGLNQLFAWLVSFGLATGSSLFLNWEYTANKKPSYLVGFISLLETFFSSLSMLSRAMVMNAGALLWGLWQKTQKTIKYSHMAVLFGVFTLLFVASVFSVNFVRTFHFNGQKITSENVSLISEKKVIGMASHIARMTLDRWVGIEGVMAVSSFPGLGWDLWRRAWQEKFQNKGTSFYDLVFIDSPYTSKDLEKHHFISLPGIIAFFYYPGSLIFLTASMFFLGIFGAFAEALIFKFTDGNVILTSLLLQVICFRYSNFGYSPAHSYVLLGGIAINVFLIWFLLNHLLSGKDEKTI